MNEINEQTYICSDADACTYLKCPYRHPHTRGSCHNCARGNRWFCSNFGRYVRCVLYIEQPTCGIDLDDIGEYVPPFTDEADVIVVSDDELAAMVMAQELDNADLRAELARANAQIERSRGDVADLVSAARATMRIAQHLQDSEDAETVKAMMDVECMIGAALAKFEVTE